MESPVEDSVVAGAEMTRLSPEARAFAQLPSIGALPTHSRPGHKQGLGAAPERGGAAGGRLPHTETVLGSGVASGRIQRVLGSSQEHVMHDPDVQGNCRPW